MQWQAVVVLTGWCTSSSSEATQGDKVREVCLTFGKRGKEEALRQDADVCSSFFRPPDSA